MAATLLRMTGLFAYGTLLYPAIVRAVTGLELPSSPATLDGFTRRRVIGELFPAIVEASGARVDGRLYTGLDERAWSRLDVFEGEPYERRSVVVIVGSVGEAAAAARERSPRASQAAIAYVLRDAWRDRLGTEPWDPDAFARDHLAALVARVARATAPRAIEPRTNDGRAGDEPP